jgi:hypothetical protein
MNFGMKIIQSNFAVEQDGTEGKEIQVKRGSFWARLFDPDPTLPLWQKTKTKVIQVPHYKPVIYMMKDQIICHPSLYEQIHAALKANHRVILLGGET